MKRALFQKRGQKNIVFCNLCPNNCRITPGHFGVCGVRRNINGTLFATNFGYAAATNIDPIEKKPLFHFMPNTFTYSFGTIGCNLSCHWCQNFEISQNLKNSPAPLGQKITPKEHLKNAIYSRCPSISYTYTEPTIFFEYALETMKLAHKNNIKNIWVTNGYINQKPFEKILPYLDAANIDIKGFDTNFQKKYTGSDPKVIRNNVELLFKSDVHLELTTLIIPSVNDSEFELNQIARWIASVSPKIPWHLSRFFPCYKMSNIKPTSIETLNMAQKIGQKAGLNHIYIGNI